MWRLSSTKVEEAAPVKMGAVMVEGMVGGSNGGREGGRGSKGGMDRHKAENVSAIYISILLSRDRLT